MTGRSWAIVGPVLAGAATTGVAFASGAAPSATADCGYLALSFDRATTFELHDGDPVGRADNGSLHYSDVHGDWYDVESVACVRINGSRVYAAGKVTSASRAIWVGRWISFAFEDGGEPGAGVDHVWGVFATEATAIYNCENEIASGPTFTLHTANLQVRH